MKQRSLHYASDTRVFTRHCRKCNQNSRFVTSGKFRVNANGKLLDVWLIYRCERCHTTWKKEILSRIRPSQIENELYRAFLDNDWPTAVRYMKLDGRNMYEKS